jgi:hypothetical protein
MRASRTIPQQRFVDSFPRIDYNDGVFGEWGVAAGGEPFRMKKVLLAVLIAAAIPWQAAEAAYYYLLAENFSLAHDIAMYPIRSYNGLLDGLDFPGEWVEYSLPVLPFGTYQVHLRCWGDPVPYMLHLMTYPAQGEEPQTIAFDFTGKGADCA